MSACQAKKEESTSKGCRRRRWSKVEVNSDEVAICDKCKAGRVAEGVEEGCTIVLDDSVIEPKKFHEELVGLSLMSLTKSSWIIGNAKENTNTCASRQDLVAGSSVFAD